MKTHAFFRNTSAALILGVLAALAPARADYGHAVTHAWTTERGNLLTNWSFENEFDTWHEHFENGVTSVARATHPGFAARSGRFMGYVGGGASYTYEMFSLSARKVPLVPKQPYTLSFYVRSVDSISSPGPGPAVRLYRDRNTLSRTVAGQEYAPFAVSKTGGPELPGWELYIMTFTPDSAERYADISFWRSTEPNSTGELYFDDVVLEEGSLGVSQINASRSRYSYSATFSDALGRTHQSQVRLPDYSGLPNRYLVQGTEYDTAGRPFKIVLPFPRSVTDPLHAGYLPDQIDSANLYYNGIAATRPDAGGYAYSEVKYAADPTGRAVETASPGYNWRLLGGRHIYSGFYFVDHLDVPAYTQIPLLSPSPGSGEQDYRVDWSTDEEQRISLTWTNRLGQVVQSASCGFGESSWVRTRMEYYPSGRLRRVLTPLDVAANDSDFAEIRNYNAQGQLTSTYSPDRGLEKFWYNKRGMLRYSQNERQRDKGAYATYYIYDHLGNLTSTGEQYLYSSPSGPHQEMADGDGDLTVWGLTEHKGYLYGSLDDLDDRLEVGTLHTGLDSLPARPGALMASWNHNRGEADGLSDTARLVADFYRYDSLGRVHKQHKYMGMLSPGEGRFHMAEYAYDTLGRMTQRDVYRDFHSSPAKRFATQSYSYDPLGRMRVITVPGEDSVASYRYTSTGALDRVWLGGWDGGAGTTVGTTLRYRYHIRGWTKDVTATQTHTGIETFRQALGYENRAIDSSSVPYPERWHYSGQISQQLYKFTSDVTNPVRVVNYTYDTQGRMTAADYRHGSGLGSYQKLDFPMTFSNSTDLDTRVAYDANGRIRGKRSGGVSSGDSAVYYYHYNSYRVERVTGKLSGTGTRTASASGTFQYDAAGNMVEDRSKGMTISYGDDGMPTLIKADSALRLRPLYDASGYRVTQAALRTFPEGYPDYWVGNSQTPLEDDFVYDVSTLDEALYRADTAMNIWNSPAPDSLVFFVVLDQGDTSMAPAWDSLTAIAKDDTLVPVRVYGMRKFSARYDSLRSLREGRLMAARHWVNLGGQVLAEVTEGYDSTETLVSTRLVAPLYGRGTPVGRVVHTDTGEVTQFYVKNHLGSTMRVVNVDGSYATTPAFDYQAYGEPQVVRNDTLNPAGPRYTGKELDAEVNLYYFGARWYDAELGAWISPDPAGEHINHYSYIGYSPLMGTDPYGMACIDIWNKSCRRENSRQFVNIRNDVGEWTYDNRDWIAATAYFAITGDAIGAFGIYQGMAIADAKGYGLTDWQTYAYAGGGFAFASVAAGGGMALGGITNSATVGLATTSTLNSVGTYALTGGQSDISTHFGAFSVNWSQGEVGYLGKNNNTMENLGYVAGMYANVGDAQKVVRAFNNTPAPARTPAAPGKNRYGDNFTGDNNADMSTEPLNARDALSKGHDIDYQAFGAEGPASAFSDSRLLGADGRFVRNQMKLALSGGNNFPTGTSSLMFRLQTAEAALGMGIMTTPKYMATFNVSY